LRLARPQASHQRRELGAADRARFDTAVLEGRGQMPPWQGVLSAQDFDQLWAYIRHHAQ
jgi:hypothetical protein